MGDGTGADRDESPRHSRYPIAVRERRAVPRAVRGGREMIVSRRWLEALLGRSIDPREAAECLTLHAAAVDAVVPPHLAPADVVVARVVEAPQHPDADPLSLRPVDPARGAPSGRVVPGAADV